MKLSYKEVVGIPALISTDIMCSQVLTRYVSLVENYHFKTNEVKNNS